MDQNEKLNRKLNPKLLRRVIAAVLCFAIIAVSIYSCNKNLESQPNNAEETPTPTISVSIIGDGDNQVSNEDEISDFIDDGIIDDIYSLVCSTVSYKLTNAGFTTNIGVAQSEKENEYYALGLYYYNDEVDFFNDPSLKSVGFVEIVDSTSSFCKADEIESVIYVCDTEENADDIQLICTYNYNDIGSSHFVYQNKYVKYYQQSSMRVVYDVYENNESNYDLSLGSLYDYDERVFIYDESIFGEYTTHSAVELFSDEDYAELEKYLKQLSDDQLRAGYIVEEYTLVYISPESIQAYIDSEEEDTFFGYSVSELTEAFGVGTALQYTEDGFVASKMVDVTSEEYNWKSFLAKTAIGCGIILVGAILTPVTGGASFGCALITISSVAVSFGLTSSLGTLAVETVKGIIDGKTIEEALYAASHKGLDAFANGFMIGAAIGSVGVVSGLIKPVACFAADTLVLCDDNGIPVYKAIEDVSVGDYVYSYDEKTGMTTAQRVSDSIVNHSDEIITIVIGSEKIVTTPEHPFYSPELAGWVEAHELQVGSVVLDVNGYERAVASVIYEKKETGIEVYNLTVENNHNYYVGANSILVHNDCTNIAKMRSKAVKDAWKEEVKAVKNGTSKYNWTSGEKRQLLELGKVKGYEGHHIIPVNELKGKIGEELIGSADDIVFLSKNAHTYLHTFGDSFAGTKDVLIELVPWVSERIQVLLPLVG